MTMLSTGRRQNRAGYTLIELILLTIIIAILIGIATPQFRKTFSYLELKDASFNLAKLVSFAQEKSIIEGTLYKLILDADKGRYYLTKEEPAASDKYIRLKERYGRIFLLPRGTKLKSKKKEIIFYPDGHSEKAAITLLGKNKSVTIEVKGNLGYVQIEEGAQR